jgi:hypothetical protein
MAAAVATTLVAATSAVRVAFAAGTGSSLPPEYTEMLRLAEERVNAANQLGAIGNGVPLLNVDLGGLIPWFGMRIAAAIGALLAARILMPRLKSEMIAQ